MNMENENQSKLLKILSIVLALSLALNVVLFIKRVKINPEEQFLQMENMSLNQKIGQYKSELNKFKGISIKIDEAVNDANLKIAEKEKQITKLYREKNVQEKENLLLLNQTDSIKELYLNVIDSLLVEREGKKVINNKIEVLEDIISGLNTKLGYAALLNADNFMVKPVKKGSGGKKQPTAIAKKVDAIEIKIDILANRITKSGLKNVYVVLTSPDAKVLFDERTGTLDFYNPDFKKNAHCSISDGVNYKNEKISYSAQFQPEEVLRPGLYIVEIFTNENKLGMTTFSLK